ncbi:MAG TPA: hypothetical protein DHW82_01135 [Spirochaetia bacterium]|nr:MAG: hypothetical protein A2Y41_02685 [Spirochaetes bacterium GWB1_36_13]HCL55600.1 hypothetical protein [Spirochaetia bacterium]
MMSNGTNQFLEKDLVLIRERLARRKGDRLLAEVDFTYKFQGKAGIYNGKSINISSYGMGFIVDTILFEGEKLLFNFKLNGENMVIPGSIIRLDGKEASVEFSISEAEIQRFIRLFNQELVREKSSIHLSAKAFKKKLD